MQKETVIEEWLRIDTASPTGLVWAKPGKKKTLGAPALTAADKDGYFVGICNYINVKAHQAVFYLTHGYIPNVIDHLDGNCQNNSPENLRDATRSENSQNQRRAKGYWKHRKAYVAEIRVHGVKYHLGSYPTEEAARAAYLAAKKVYHPTAPSY